jgi:large subunit ribosomal protein L15
MPLHRRLPKRGFHNVFRVEYAIVNLDDLSKRFEASTDVTPDLLRTHGLIGRSDRLIKVLARGEMSVALTIHAHRFSRKASEKIVAAGGKAIELNRHQPKVVEDSGEEK